MKGYGLTTLKGARIDRFDIEVVGILRGWDPQGSVVMVKMSSPVLDKTGTIAGMSGSPVYVNDRLLGAVAYGFPNCTIPLAGVTPFEEMLVSGEIEEQGARQDEAGRKTAYRRALLADMRALLQASIRADAPDDAAVRAAADNMVAPLCLRRRALPWPASQMPGPVRSMLPEHGAPALGRLPLPLTIGGTSAAGLASLGSTLSASGFLPVQGGAHASAGAQADAVAAVPGAPIGVAFITGDIDIAGMGTLTALDGDRVLAFGHPMFDGGEAGGQLNYPLALGRVQAIVPSALHSFRLTSTERLVGALTRDTSAAIVGRLGAEAPMFPCVVKVKGVRDVTYSYSIAAYWETAPYFAFIATALSGLRWEGAASLTTTRAKVTLSIQGREEPVVMQRLYVGDNVVAPARELVLMPLSLLSYNEFEQADIASVAMELEVEPGIRAAFIQGLRAPLREVRPGEKLTLFVRLKEFQGPGSVRKIELQIPEDARPGQRVRVIVCSAWSSFLMDMSGDPGFAQPRDADAIVQILNSMPEGAGLYAHASIVTSGLRYEGVPMPDLPPSAVTMLTGAGETGVTTPLLRTVKASVPTSMVIVGNAHHSVLVADPDKGNVPPQEVSR